MQTDNETAGRLLIKAPHCNACVYGGWYDECQRRAPIVGADPDHVAVWPLVDEAFTNACGDGLFITAWLFDGDVKLQGLPRLVNFETARQLAKIEDGNVSETKSKTPLYVVDEEALAKLLGQ
ncbi:MAG: hypothetical protein ACOYXY_10110 [Thermodesulfobacteriota bacterium]